MSEPESTITKTFGVVMQKGIEACRPYPRPQVLYIITRAAHSPMFSVWTKVPAEGHPFLKDDLSRMLKIVDHEASIVRLQQLMAEIPTQYSEVEDMYGRNTSVVHETDLWHFGNLFLSGSRAPKGIPHPTEEQKVLFDEVVAIIENWAAKEGPR